ncbi:MAG TPA: DUF1257 domain-containing protein [Anaerolinea sp.]|nr:DUF1257 domain-containing protein [Anaerolinea sp.]
MSHFTRIQTKITDKAHLLSALQDLGFTAQEGEQEIRGFAGQKMAVEIRVAIPLSFDIGFHKIGNSYEAVADWSGVRGIKSQEFIQKVTQRYAYHATKEKLAEQGFTLVEEQVNETGQIRLLLRRMN